MVNENSNTSGQTETKGVGEIVADILAPMRIRQESSNRLQKPTMGNEISSADEAQPVVLLTEKETSSNKKILGFF